MKVELLSSYIGKIDRLNVSDFNELEKEMKQLPFVYVIERSAADGTICGYNDEGKVVARAIIKKEE